MSDRPTRQASVLPPLSLEHLPRMSTTQAQTTGLVRQHRSPGSVMSRGERSEFSTFKESLEASHSLMRNTELAPEMRKLRDELDDRVAVRQQFDRVDAKLEKLKRSRQRHLPGGATYRNRPNEHANEFYLESRRVAKKLMRQNELTLQRQLKETYRPMLDSELEQINTARTLEDPVRATYPTFKDRMTKMSGRNFERRVALDVEKRLLSDLTFNQMIGPAQRRLHLVIHDISATQLDETRTRLALSSRLLTTLPMSLFTVTQLTDLDLSGNTIAKLPEEIRDLACLTRLSLTNNHLITLPLSLASLSDLMDLEAAGNWFKAIPLVVSSLTTLVSLDLSNNHIRWVPHEIGNLVNLARLNLGTNELRELPPEIGLLTALHSLSVEVNDLKSLPPEIGYLDSLDTLVAYSCRLTSLPSDIGYMTSLMQLELQDNALRHIPSSIGALTRLNGLIIEQNRLETLPRTIGLLTSLSKLYLEGNPWTSMPRELTHLRRSTISVKSAGKTLETWLLEKCPNFMQIAATGEIPIEMSPGELTVTRD